MTGLMSNDPRAAGLPDTPAPAICKFCGAERYTEGVDLFGTGKIIWFPGGPNPCACPEGQAQYEREQTQREAHIEATKRAEADKRTSDRAWNAIRKSGMGERFRRRTFRSYTADTQERKDILKAAQTYAQNFGQQLPRQGSLLPGRNGLFIRGSIGVGKTHIAAAIANYLLNRGTAVVCMTERNLLGEIKRTYSQGGDESAVRETYERVPLLVIDDLGKEKPTEWTLATLYAIIDGRYDRAMPIIITTNYDAKSLVTRLTPTLPNGTKDTTTASAIVDRLVEMCESIVMHGASWRSRQGA
jgi:DNA replication protein DnaC